MEGESIVSNFMQSKTRRSVGIAASVLAVTALVLTSFLLTDSSEPTPTAVEPGITNTAQVPTAETVAPTAAAVDRAAASDDAYQHNMERICGKT